MSVKGIPGTLGVGDVDDLEAWRYTHDVFEAPCEQAVRRHRPRDIEDLTRVDVAAKVVLRVVAKRRGQPDPVVKAAH